MATIHCCTGNHPETAEQLMWQGFQMGAVSESFAGIFLCIEYKPLA
uniref:Uncharacterized protein n=1 Tax=Anguilla anguilla TaxID=7936 RepID=A0A0E9SQW2_ANGAN